MSDGAVLGMKRACLEETVPWLPILMYHRVVPRVEEPDPHSLKVSTREFDAQMRYLKDRGYESVYFDGLAVAASNGDSPWTKPVIITFDDGYRDTFTNALPILKRYQLRATVLLVSAHVEGSNLWDRCWAEASPLAGLDEIREVAKHGIRFGAHGVTHRPLTELSAEGPTVRWLVPRQTWKTYWAATSQPFSTRIAGLRRCTARWRGTPATLPPVASSSGSTTRELWVVRLGSDIELMAKDIG